MKKLLTLLMLIALLSAGCVTLPLSPWKTETPVPTEKETVPLPAPVAPPVVMPDQVTAENAGEIARALRTELDFETSRGKK